MTRQQLIEINFEFLRKYSWSTPDIQKRISNFFSWFDKEEKQEENFATLIIIISFLCATIPGLKDHIEYHTKTLLETINDKDKSEKQ